MAVNYWSKFEPSQIFHIYNRSVPGSLLFKTDDDYAFFLQKYTKYLAPYLLTYAYCLIPNHFHLLVQVRPLDDCLRIIKNEKSKAATLVLAGNSSLNQFLEDQMRRFFSSVSLKYNHKYQRRGSLLTERFKRVYVSTEQKLLYLICYIHHNPIHHGLRSNMKDWKYSSYKTYYHEKTTLLEKDKILDWFGGISYFKDAHKTFTIDHSENLNVDISEEL